MIIQLLKNRLIQHITGWVSLYILFIFNNNNKPILLDELWAFSLHLAALFSLIIALTYLHFYFLKFIPKKQYVLYVVLTLIGFSVIVTIDILFVQENMNLLVSQRITQSVSNFSVLLIITTGLKYIKQGITNHTTIQNMKQKQLETEYNLLQAQVNPHFLFNILNNMYALSLRKDDRLSDMILELSDLMRYQLETSRKHEVLLQDEINYLHNYVRLEQIRIQKFCQIEFQTKGNAKHVRIAPLLFIPFIENSCKYGIEINKKNYIRINFHINENHLHFSIENLVPKNHQKETGLGTGIKNVRERLEILYPKQHELHIVNTGKIFKVDLVIQFKQKLS